MVNLIYNNLFFLNSLISPVQNNNIIENTAKNFFSDNFETFFAKERKLSLLTITTGLIITTCVLFIFIKTLANRPISEETRGALVRNAAIHQNQEMLTALLAHGPISEEARREAIARAAIHQNQEMITTLLAHGPISEVAIESPASLQNQEMLPSLLADGSISEEAR